MGRGADAAHEQAAASFQLGRAEIPLDTLTVVISNRPAAALMRPDGVRAAAFSLVMTGIVHQDHVDVAVIVGIILAEIDFGIEQAACLLQGLPGPFRLVLSVILARLGHRHRAVNLEHRLVFAVGIFVVIITDRTGTAVRGVAFLVEHVGKSRLRIVDDKLLVAEIHENDRNLVPSLRERPGMGGLRPHLGRRAPHLGRFLPLRGGRHRGRPIETVRALGNNLTALVGDIMEPFVAMDLDRNDRSVRLHHLDLSRIGRNGEKGIEGTREECEGYKNLSHGYWIWTRKPVPPSAISQALPSSTLTTVTVKSSAWVAACLM